MTEAVAGTRRQHRTGRSRSSSPAAIAAIAAGAVLLLGGGTTLAYWTTTQTLAGGTVVAGDFDLQLGTATWQLDGAVGEPATVTDPAAVRIVPGDVLTLEQTLDVTLVGDTLEAILSVDAADMVPAADADAFDVELVVDGVGTAEGSDAYRLTPADVAAPITATVTITFDAATTGQDQTGTTVDLDAVDFTLTQASS